ncbi:MAG: DUF11 domain-containing protein [Clostridia bacterium]|nr:DUF11 domain-containing protein [Clostridia bacterium]
MISKLKSKIIVLLTTIMMLCVSLGVVLFVPAMADTTITTFKMKDGASIRMQEPYGIRFAAELSASDYATLKGQGVSEFGMIVAPHDFITDENGNVDISDFKIDSATFKKYVANETDTSTDKYFNWTTVTPELDEDDYDEDGDKTEYVIMASFVNILPSNISRPFSARAYYKVGENYTSTDSIATRSIYTVASKAVNNGLIDSSDTEVSDYFNNIISTVESSYTDKSITLEGITDGKTSVGNTFNIKATVSKTVGEETKTLDSCANVVITDKDGNETDIVSENSDGSYTVDYLGDFKITATLGDKTEVFEIENSTYNIFTTHDDIKGINNATNTSKIKNYKPAASNMQWTMMSSYAGHDNVLIWERKTSGEIVDHINNYGFTFSSDVLKLMKKDMYLYMDIYYVPNSSSSANNLYPVASDVTATAFSDNLSQGTEYRSFYYADGTDVTASRGPAWSSVAQNCWLTLEHKLTKNWTDSNYFTILNCGYKNAMYFANIRLSTEKIENPVIDIVKEFDTPLSCNTETFTSLTFETTDDVGGRDGVKKYSSAYSNLSSNYAINFTSAVRSEMKAGTYLYFDLYQTATNYLQIDCGSTSYKWYPHNAKTVSNARVEGRILDGSSGTYASSSFASNKWVTLEVYCKVDFSDLTFRIWPSSARSQHFYIDPASVRVFDEQQTGPYQEPTVLEDPKLVQSTETDLTDNQKAVREVALAYYRQRDRINYEQYNNRRMVRVSPEEATAQRMVYLDCSTFVNNCYMEAFGVPIIPEDIATENKWSSNTAYYSEYASKYQNNSDDVIGHWVNANYTTAEAQTELLTEVKNALKVGDIVNYRHSRSGGEAGHVYIYMGDGQLMHCFSGGSYQFDADDPSQSHDSSLGETNVIIDYISVDSLFTDTTHERYLFKAESSDTVINFSLLRPLNRGLTITDETKGRMSIQGLVMEKVSSVKMNSAVYQGGQITYTITLKNVLATALDGVTLADVIPAGTTFVEGSTGVTNDKGAITWNGSVNGASTVTITYTVKVADDAAAGSLIVSDQTTVNSVNLGTITNTVSGYTAEQLTAVADKAKNATAEGVINPLDIVKSVYADYLDANFLNNYATVQALLDDLIDTTNKTKKTDTDVSKMIAPNLFGGVDIKSGWTTDAQRTRIVTEGDLALGDVIVAEYGDANSLVYIYAGNKTLVRITFDGITVAVDTLTIGTDIMNPASSSDSPNYLVSLVAYDRFAVIRPSMVATTVAE